MDRRARVLIVDDEPDIAGMLDEFFQMEGYATAVAHDGAAALAAVSGGAPIDIILLDVNMPGMDGFEVCRRIREHLACPIIFLTARIEDVDQLDGFAAGADDYVLKPFSLEVLGSRVRAHLAREERRVSSASGASGAQAVRLFSGFTVDYAARTVEVVTDLEADERPHGTSASLAPSRILLDLTRIEFDIIALLSKSPGRVYDRETIYERVWGWNATGAPTIVREHVRRIRRKFEEAGVADPCIETVWGVGYKWVAR